MPMSFQNSVSRVVGDESVPGTYLQAFIKNGDHYFVTEIKIYKDGKIDCWGLVDFEGFKEKIRQGWVRTSVPNGARISTMVSALNFTVDNVRGGIDEGEFVKQVSDEIDELNERATSAEVCKECLCRHRESPSDASIQALRVAYENVPTHMRRFLGDMDSKDWEYRTALGIK